MNVAWRSARTSALRPPLASVSRAVRPRLITRLSPGRSSARSSRSQTWYSFMKPRSVSAEEAEVVVQPGRAALLAAGAEQEDRAVLVGVLVAGGLHQIVVRWKPWNEREGVGPRWPW